MLAGSLRFFLIERFYILHCRANMICNFRSLKCNQITLKYGTIHMVIC